MKWRNLRKMSDCSLSINKNKSSYQLSVITQFDFLSKKKMKTFENFSSILEEMSDPGNYRSVFNFLSIINFLKY